MATIIYLHGWASVGDNPKSRALREAFPEHTVLAPDLPVEPDAIIELVSKLVRDRCLDKLNPLIFVGTSNGGFWANYFAHKWDAPAVLVNPSTLPSIGMARRVGVEQKNYATGEPITVTPDTVAAYQAVEDEASQLYNGSLISLFVAQDDAILDYRWALDYFRFTAFQMATLDGGHRYESHWPTVIARVAELLEQAAAYSKAAEGNKELPA